ncbi:hypothetical protein PU629_20690 [Pullulanibacillus sp. KACC 23026]|nr:hypothetical protein [Pullulanibacillus sp. KACC 23026]WEG12487.1 hypothetical protein PU629_20690 [Pullulanibacillus sp. KACC 23026]
MDEAAGRAFIKGMNAKIELRAVKKGVHQEDERRNKWMRQPEGRSSRG